MKLFNKRPLGLVLFILLSGFSVFAIGSTLFKIFALCISVTLCFLSFILKKFEGTLPKIACFSLLFSFLLSHVYFGYVFYPSEYFGENVKLVAKIENIDEKTDSYTVLDLKTLSINGNDESYDVKLNLYGYHDNVTVGAIVEIEAELEEFKSDTDFDFKAFYTSRGFSATADASDLVTVATEDEPLLYRFSELRKSIYDRAVNLSNSKSGSMLGALLLGERNLLPNQVRLDFQRIGITHILSLSGMHVAILMGGLDRLLYILRIKKTPRIMIGCLANLAFMALTGFPVTVCRAGIMLIISSILFLITGSKDSVTSLFVAASMIMIVTPYAALDIGLWLSIIATVGILVASEVLHDKYSEVTGLKKFLAGLKTSVIFSLFAVAASAIISTLSFNGTSAISIFSTLVFSVLVEIFVYLGIAMLLMGEILPIGNIVNFVSDIIYSLATDLSDLPLIYGSVKFLIVKLAFILLSVAFVLFAVLDIKKRKIFIGAIASLFCIATVLSIGLTELAKDDDVFVCYNDASERILIRSKGESMLYDASQHRKSDGYINNRILSDERITELDFYMLANYTDFVPDSIDVILTSLKVDTVLLPIPRNKNEDDIALKALNVAEKFRTKLSFYGDMEILNFGEYKILTPFRTDGETSFATTFNHSDKMLYTYFSSGILEYCPESEELLNVSDTVIFGDYGTAYSNSKIVDEFSYKLKTVIIFDDNMYFDVQYSEGMPPKILYPKEKHIIYD